MYFRDGIGMSMSNSYSKWVVILLGRVLHRVGEIVPSFRFFFCLSFFFPKALYELSRTAIQINRMLWKASNVYGPTSSPKFLYVFAKNVFPNGMFWQRLIQQRRQLLTSLVYSWIRYAYFKQSSWSMLQNFFIPARFLSLVLRCSSFLRSQRVILTMESSAPMLKVIVSGQKLFLSRDYSSYYLQNKARRRLCRFLLKCWKQ